MQGTQPIHRLKTIELECSTTMEVALHVILWDAYDDELEDVSVVVEKEWARH